ncbi:MAG: hypothetical protein K6A67_00425 [Bacteroidales bacterium]|nr:hypothetical protein [Bacteroidales bacterium]
MKKILYIVFGLLFANTIYAQQANTGTLGDIPIAVVAAKQQNVPESANTYMENKLQQVICQNGLGSSDYHGRFVVTASVVAVTKDIVPGPPRQVAANYDVTFYIVDNIDRKVFSSVTVAAKVVESSEEKALIKAIRSINVKSKQITSFIDEGRGKIVDYYANHADQIIRTAMSLAKQRRYEEAFYELCAIPEACGDAYSKALTAADAIYQEYVNYMCDVNLAKARSAWAAEQNAAGASVAGEYLALIYPDAKCYAEAQKLYEQIKEKVLDDWKFEIRRYDDEISLEKQRILAWRAVGMAYGNHQQPVDYNVNWLVR